MIEQLSEELVTLPVKMFALTFRVPDVQNTTAVLNESLEVTLLSKEQEGPLGICFRSTGSCRCEIRIHKPFAQSLFFSICI